MCLWKCIVILRLFALPGAPLLLSVVFLFQPIRLHTEHFWRLRLACTSSFCSLHSNSNCNRQCSKLASVSVSQTWFKLRKGPIDNEKEWKKIENITFYTNISKHNFIIFANNFNWKQTHHFICTELLLCDFILLNKLHIVLLIHLT